jgi:hypothetical protein
MASITNNVYASEELRGDRRRGSTGEAIQSSTVDSIQEPEECGFSCKTLPHRKKMSISSLPYEGAVEQQPSEVSSSALLMMRRKSRESKDSMTFLPVSSLQEPLLSSSSLSRHQQQRTLSYSSDEEDHEMTKRRKDEKEFDRLRHKRKLLDKSSQTPSEHHAEYMGMMRRSSSQEKPRKEETDKSCRKQAFEQHQVMHEFVQQREDDIRAKTKKEQGNQRWEEDKKEDTRQGEHPPQHKMQEMRKMEIDEETSKRKTPHEEQEDDVVREMRKKEKMEKKVTSRQEVMSKRTSSFPSERTSLSQGEEESFPVSSRVTSEEKNQAVLLQDNEESISKEPYHENWSSSKEQVEKTIEDEESYEKTGDRIHSPSLITKERKKDRNSITDEMMETRLQSPPDSSPYLHMKQSVQNQTDSSSSSSTEPYYVSSGESGRDRGYRGEVEEEEYLTQEERMTMTSKKDMNESKKKTVMTPSSVTTKIRTKRRINETYSACSSSSSLSSDASESSTSGTKSISEVLLSHPSSPSSCKLEQKSQELDLQPTVSDATTVMERKVLQTQDQGKDSLDRQHPSDVMKSSQEDESRFAVTSLEGSLDTHSDSKDPRRSRRSTDNQITSSSSVSTSAFLAKEMEDHDVELVEETRTPHEEVRAMQEGLHTETLVSPESEGTLFSGSSHVIDLISSAGDEEEDMEEGLEEEGTRESGSSVYVTATDHTPRSSTSRSRDVTTATTTRSSSKRSDEARLLARQTDNMTGTGTTTTSFETASSSLFSSPGSLSLDPRRKSSESNADYCSLVEEATDTPTPEPQVSQLRNYIRCSTHQKEHFEPKKVKQD